MHALFRLTEVLPLAPGTSEFRVRGMYYSRLLGRADATAGGREGLLQGLKDARVREYVERSFAWSDWYDALPTLPLHIAVARLEGAEFEPGTRAKAREAVADTLARVYRSAFSGVDRTSFLEQIPRLMSAQLDFGDAVIDSYSEGSLQITIEGIPRLIAPSLCNVLVGITLGVLDVMEVADASADYTDIRLEGQARGLQVVAMTLVANWTSAT